MSPHRATTALFVCMLCRYISIPVICASNKVFVLLIGPSSSSCHYPCVTETCSPMRLLPYCFFFVQHNHTVGALSLVRLVLTTPTRAFTPNALLDLANLAAPRRSGGLTTSTAALTLLFPPHLLQFCRCLSSMSTTALTTSTSASPPPTITISTHLHHYHDALVCMQLNRHAT